MTSTKQPRTRTYPELEDCLHISLDIETLGTKPGCKVLSIGACVVGDAERQFYTEVCPDMQRGEVNPSTGAWWENQPGGQLFLASCQYGGRSMRGALGKLADWLEEVQLPNKPLRIWTRGQFDLPILEWHYNAEGLEVPWHYWESMDLRTAMAMFPRVSVPRDPDELPAHHALGDAKYQALCVTQVIREASTS